MKKLVLFLIIIASVAVGLILTTPNRQQHVDPIKQILMNTVNAELRYMHIDGPYGSIASVAASVAIDSFLNTSLIIRDNTFYSLGFVDYNGQFQLTSFGIWGHVYTLNEDQARQIVKNKLGDFDLRELLPKQYIE